MGAGTYQELVVPPKASLTYTASGAVIIDGQTVRNGFDTNFANVTINGFKFINCGQSVWFRSGGTNGRAENCESSATTQRGFYAQGAANVRFVNCYSHGITSGYDFEFELNADNGACIRCWGTGGGQYNFISKTSLNVRFDGCVGIGASTAAFYSKGANGMKVYNCVGYNCANGVYLSDDTVPAYSSNAVIKNSIFVLISGTGILATATNDASGLVSNYNDFYACGDIGRIAATSYHALANWQGAGYDTNSFAIDPAYASVVYGSFALPGGSSLKNAGTDVGQASATPDLGREGSTWAA